MGMRLGIAGVLAGLMLCACGGGGSSAPATGDTSGSSTPAAADTPRGTPPLQLSATQAMFDEAGLAANGGLFELYATGIPTLPLQMVLLSADELSMPSSPASTPDGVQSTYTPINNFVASLPSDPFYDDSDPNLGLTYLQAGQLHFVQAGAAPKVVYSGSDVILEYAMTGSSTPLRERITQIAKLPLIGHLADAPDDFKLLYAFDPAHVDAAATFGSGAAYYRMTTVRSGSAVQLFDSDFDSATDPRSATPLQAGTIEQYATAFPNSLKLNLGTIQTVEGARCWVETAADTAANGAQTFRFVSPSFTVYCEVGGNVYRGLLQPDGAQVRSAYLQSDAVNPFLPIPYVVRMNKAAIDSMKRILH